MSTIETKKKSIVLGVTGSIAAFKAADLTSKLTQQGIKVNVIMTESATKLVQPQTFFTLSREPVITSLWDAPSWQPEHIKLAEESDLLVIAPATADIIAKMAHGIADDALSTYCLSHTKEVLVFPAMNPRMWHNAATQENVATLRRRGIDVVNPASGHVACGEEGDGRFPEVPLIVDYIKAKLTTTKRCKGKLLVTAGPTREAIDPVRFLSNNSTGKMGFSVATAGSAMGFDVTLIAGPVNLPTPLGVRRIDIVSAKDMKEKAIEEFANCDYMVMTAAVADYTPANVADQKIHKQGDMDLKLTRTDDVLFCLKEIAQKDQKKRVVCGFAAETQNIEQSALSKMERKGLDFIVSNDVSRKDIGFKSDDNEVNIYVKDGSKIHLDKQPKLSVAAKILETISNQ